MRRLGSRTEDATFELNLAPMLDIIVSIVPMLLLSVVFTQIAMIETPVPQAVEKAMQAAQDKPNEVSITVHVSKTTGIKVSVSDKGESKEILIASQGGVFDLDRLQKEMHSVKTRYPQVFRLELHPDDTVQLSEIVAVMDRVRSKAKGDAQLVFTDVESGKKVETDLMFPDVVFGNVAGG